MDMKTVVFSDMHGRQDVVWNLFEKIGLVDAEGNRNEGFHTIQLGDAVSLGYDEQEAEFLKWVEPFIDEWLLGNHELPAIWHTPEAMDFYGYWPKGSDENAGYEIVADKRQRYDFKIGADPVAKHMVQQRFHAGGYKVATSVGKWLISHAGVAIMHQRKHRYFGVEPDLIAEDLEGRFKRCLENHAEDMVITNSSSQLGSIFWLRAEHLRNGYTEKHVPQIVGHTPFGSVKWPIPGKLSKAENLWAIDTEGSCFALVTEDDGENWETWQSDYYVEHGDRLKVPRLYDYHKETP